MKSACSFLSRVLSSKIILGTILQIWNSHCEDSRPTCVSAKKDAHSVAVGRDRCWRYMGSRAVESACRVSGRYGQGAGGSSGGRVRECEARAHGYIDGAVCGGLGIGRCGLWCEAFRDVASER